MLAFAVAAFLIAGVVIFWTIRSQQPHEVARINLPPGSSPKAQWMKTHQDTQQMPGQEIGTVKQDTGSSQ
jgi:hypothetical protein